MSARPCQSTSNAVSGPTRRRLIGGAVAAILLAGCSGPATDGGEQAASGAGFPVSIEHAFGSTTIPQEPVRVVAWGWGSADAAIALGVVPVAIPFQAYGGDEQGVLPWISEELERQGAPMPEVLPDAQDAPVEAIAAMNPDVILAPYSGITDSEYALLSAIAPTVAYPEQPWATPWRETIQIVGDALGRPERAQELLAGIDAEIAAQAQAHPEFQGRSVAVVFDYAGTFSVYKQADPRVQFTLDLGFEHAESVDRLANGDETFYYDLSYERLGELESDILVSYADSAALSDTFLASPPAQLMEQVRDGAVAEVVGQSFVASVGPPTALSLTWGLEDYVARLAEAVGNLG